MTTHPFKDGRSIALVASFVTALVVGSAGSAQAQGNFGNPNLQCPHGQWLRDNFYTTWPMSRRATFFAQDVALANQHLDSDIFGLGCHGEAGGVFKWDNPVGPSTVASNQFTRRFCASPGVLHSQEGFLFACRTANPGASGTMADTGIAWIAARTGKPVTGATEYLSVSTGGDLWVEGWNDAGTMKNASCGRLDSFIKAIPYRNRNTGYFNPLDCKFIVQPADQLEFFGALTAHYNSGASTCRHWRCDATFAGALPCYTNYRVGMPGADHGEFLRRQGWHSEAAACRRSPWGGRIGTIGCMAPGIYAGRWELEMAMAGTPNAPVPPDVMLAMALDPWGTYIGAGLDVANMPVLIIQNQWHLNHQDYYYGNNLPVPVQFQINRGSERDQRQSWEVLQQLRGKQTINGDGKIVPWNALRGPGQCGGGDVRANRVDPPYEDGGAEAVGCAASSPAAGATWLALVVGALVHRRRRRRTRS